MDSDSDSFDNVLRAVARAPAVPLEQAKRLSAGDSVGRFVVEDRLGSGGMGVVYRAHDPELERTIALKLHRNLDRANATERLVREAKTMAKLSHPNVVTIYEVGTHHDQVFIAMEYAPGGTLREWMERQRPWREVLRQFIAAGRGLAAAHEIGLVHRDFKPDNVLLDARGRPRVADFGLALLASSSAIESKPAPDSDPSVDRLTTAGAAVGTLAYMAPEQFASGQALATADQFAFSASLFEALYGRLPFMQRAGKQRLAAIEAGALPEPSTSDVPRRIFAAVKRGLSAEPEHRYPTMEALLAALEHDPSVARNRVALGLALAATSSAAIWLALDEPASSDPCAGAADHIDDTWGAQRRSGIEQGLATVRRADPTTPPHALRAIDAFVASWRSERIDACQDTERGDQSSALLELRVACLARRRAALEGTVRVLETNDQAVLRRADSLASALPAPTSCSDADALTRDVAPPADSQADSVAALRADIAEVGARVSTNQIAGTGDRMEAIERSAAGLDYPPLRVETAYAHAKFREAIGQSQAAAEGFESAMMLALEIGHDELTPLAAAKLAFIVGVTSRDVQGAKRLLGVARAITAKRPSLRAQLLTEGVASSVARQEGDFVTALAAAKRAVDLRTEMADGDTAQAWAERGHYAMMLLEAGQSTEAGDELDRIVALIENRYGKHDSRLLDPLQRSAVMRAQSGDFAGARPLFERRVQIAELTHGTDSLELVRCLREASQIDVVAGEDASAQAKLERALSIYERLPEPDDVVHSELLSQQAQLEEGRGDCVAALATFERAEQRLASSVGPNSRQAAALALSGLQCRTEVDGAEIALSTALRALSIQEANAGATSLTLGTFVTVAAQVAGLAEDHERVLELTERGLRILEANKIDRGMLTTTLRFERGRALSASGQRAQARDEFLGALRSIELQPPTDREHVESLRNVAVWLGEYPEHRERAHAAATKAREIASRHETSWATGELEALDDWLARHPLR